MCLKIMCFFTMLGGIPWGRTVTGAKPVELELIISIDTPNGSGASWIAWLSANSLSYDNDKTKCWISLLIGDSVCNSRFRKIWSVAAWWTIWWLSTSPKCWCESERKKQLPLPNTSTSLKFQSNNFFSKFMTFSISAFSSIFWILAFFLLAVPELNFTLFL